LQPSDLDGDDMTDLVPIAEGLFAGPSDAPHLIGSRCRDCDNHMFPTQAGCSRCSGASTETVELDRQGVLWTWTVQSYPPKAPPYAGDDDPATFEPYGVGYVDLGGKLLVESRLTVADPDQLEIGMEVELVLDPLYVDDEGRQVVTFAFAPLDRSTAAEGAQR
jgi:uncharacterized OB-fold protein